MRRESKGGEKKVRKIKINIRVKVTIDVKNIYGDIAKLTALPEYEAKAVKLVGEGNEVVLTGAGPVWLYLKIAHALHGKCVKLMYNSPVTGEVVIFDHNPL